MWERAGKTARHTRNLHSRSTNVFIDKLLTQSFGVITSSVTDAIVNIQKLVKTYPGKVPVEAVKGIDLAVERGELFGLLGPNGAGKSTTISVCTTRSLPTAGRVTIAGIDVVEHPSEARRYMGVVTQFNTLDRQCTVCENLYFHCRYFGIPHAESAKRPTN